MTEFSKYTTSWKIVLELMTGNVVISEVAAVIQVYVVQSIKTRALWGISWYRKMYNIIDELSHKPRLLYPCSTVL